MLFVWIPIPFVCKGSGNCGTEVMQNFFLCVYTEEIENHCLLHLNNLLISIGGNPFYHYGLPTTTLNNDSINNRKYLEEMNYDQCN